MMKKPIYTEKTKCRDCYKCVRICPVKAIQVQDNSAWIIHENCIYCGLCVGICPSQAKKVRNDVDRAKDFIASGKDVILSIAPSWSTGIFGTASAMISTFKTLGFTHVSETAIGAQIVSSHLASTLPGQGGIKISSACPSVVELVKKYYPEQIENITSCLSPLGAHSAFLKGKMGTDTIVIFAGPCIAKKVEADDPESPVDLSLTFDEILEWVKEEGLDFNTSSQERFSPFSASTSTLYSLEGGMKSSIESNKGGDSLSIIPLSGIGPIMDAFDGIDSDEDLFLELLACPGGCVNGSGLQGKDKQFHYRKKSLEYYDLVSEQEDHSIGPVPILRLYEAEDKLFDTNFSEEQLVKALEELGKVSDEDILDCGGCGYNSCRDFARAYLMGMGEKQMCVTNMRKRAQKKMDMLLKTLPMGVAIVNKDLKIAECNAEFVKLFGEIDFEPDEEFIQNFYGLEIRRFIDVTPSLQTILSGKKNLFQERIKHQNRFMKLSFFSIERLHLVGVIFQDTTSTSVKREVVIKKAEEVINKNLANVQQIASLLGENAAETEIILRSLTDEFQFVSSEGEG